MTDQPKNTVPTEGPDHEAAREYAVAMTTPWDEGGQPGAAGVNNLAAWALVLADEVERLRLQAEQHDFDQEYGEGSAWREAHDAWRGAEDLLAYAEEDKRKAEAERDELRTQVANLRRPEGATVERDCPKCGEQNTYRCVEGHEGKRSICGKCGHVWTHPSIEGRPTATKRHTYDDGLQDARAYDGALLRAHIAASKKREMALRAERDALADEVERLRGDAALADLSTVASGFAVADRDALADERDRLREALRDNHALLRRFQDGETSLIETMDGITTALTEAPTAGPDTGDGT